MDRAERLRDRADLPRERHPRVLRAVRPVHPGHDRGVLPGQRLILLDRRLLEGPVDSAAPALLGARLVRDDETGRRVGRIVEVEAYGGPDDRASHARFDSTRRNRVMAGRPGVAYVYLVYGMYDCLNVVTGPVGAPSAVLIRAVEPLEGVDLMRTARLAVAGRRRAARTSAGADAARAKLERTPDHRLASGPGMVAASFGVDTGWTGRDMCVRDAPLRLERDPADPTDAVPDGSVLTTPRIGVAYAGPDWAARPWRFAIVGHRSVSGRAAR